MRSEWNNLMAKVELKAQRKNLKGRLEGKSGWKNLIEKVEWYA